MNTNECAINQYFRVLFELNIFFLMGKCPDSIFVYLGQGGVVLEGLYTLR